MALMAEVHVEALHATFRGLTDGTVEQYRNLKYGHIPARFSLAVPYNDFSGVVIDATKQGPICPQDTPYQDSLIGIAPEQVSPFEEVYDELNCLNMMITRPQGNFVKLPVVVWIHGGGNMAGTPYRTVCDPSDWVRRGVTTGKPFIFVSLQFRIHMFGFLPFNGIGNFGLHDQRLGLQWVHDHIESFGGDSGQVTVIGQSAGSCNVAAQASKPGAAKLFRQVGLLSGSISSMPSVSLSEYEHKARFIAELAGTTVQGLKTIPWQVLVAATCKAGITVAFPVDDGHFLPKGMFGSPHIETEAIIISDCREDGYFFAEYFPDDRQLFNEIEHNFGKSKESTRALLSEYNITDDGLTVRKKVCDVLTDALFCQGNECMDIALRREGVRVYRQIFDAVNPFNEAFGNNHMVDVLYLFNAYSVSEPFVKITQQLQDRWISFFYGEAPWAEGTILVVDNDVIELDINLRSRYRRKDRFEVVGELNPQLIHRLCGDGWYMVDVDASEDREETVAATTPAVYTGSA
jgi:carboxylesterase type B